MTNCNQIRTTLLVTLFSTLAYTSSVYSDPLPNNDDPSTFLGPIGRIGLTSNIGTESAFSIAAEGGPRDARLGASLGWDIGDYQRFKVTAEYLWQRINYGFFSGNENAWVQQGAVGVGYQYDLLKSCLFPQLGFNAYVSHAHPNNLGSIEGVFFNAQSVSQPFINNMRLTGSTAFGVGPVLTVRPWRNAKLSGEVNYENVGYDNDFPVNQNARGFGAIARITQGLTPHSDLGLSAEIRQPFNNYSANLNWYTGHACSEWIIGVFGNYLVGKHTLPDTYNFGVSFNYLLDRRKPESKASEGNSAPPIYVFDKENLVAWTAIPAVYMPVAMSVADQELILP